MSDSESGFFMTAETLYTNYDEGHYKNYDINIIRNNKTYEKLKGIRKYKNEQRTMQFNTDIFTYEFSFDNDKFWIEDLPAYYEEKVQVIFYDNPLNPSNSQMNRGRKRKRRGSSRR